METQSMLSQAPDDINLKLSELEKQKKLLSKRTNKDEKLLRMQKKMFDKSIQKFNLKIQEQEKLLKEKDKELRMQALKIKELVYAGTQVQRDQIIKRDLHQLQSLTSAASPNRHLSSLNAGEIDSANRKKLQMQREHQL